MDTTSVYARVPGTFLASPVSEKAGFIEVRMGSSAPLPLTPDFQWAQFPITGLEYDSRKVTPGSLYFAFPGLHADGHNFISDAITRGALAVIHEKELESYQDGVLYIRTVNARFAMSPVADSFYGHPSQHMGIIGVTGTEGKSTTVYLIYQLLKLMGRKAGFISTVQHGDGIHDKQNPEHQTTPEAVTIHRLLADMRQNGAEFAVVESSSHGLSVRTNRLGDVDFDVAVMTNVTHEHLEFHGTWEQYRNDKAELFRRLDFSPSAHMKLPSVSTTTHDDDLPLPSFGVANADDPSASFFAAATKRKTYTFSTKGAHADLSLQCLESGADGNWYEAALGTSGTKLTIRDQLPGAFNAGNVLASLLAVSNILSVDIQTVAALVPLLKPVLGRMTTVQYGQPFEVLVDYAHTPSSFETILPPLKERLTAKGGKLIMVFGSAGDRDTQKRPVQGEIAARYSDIIILTDEDPRSEQPMAILEDIASGCDRAGTLEREKTLFLITDRPAAIRKAISLAQKGDIVLLLGKGHENSIIYTDTIVYDEIKEAQTALQEAGYHIAYYEK